MSDGLLDGRPFRVKIGYTTQFTNYFHSIRPREMGKDDGSIGRKSPDPAMALLIIGGIIWAISRANAKSLEEDYIDYL